MDKDLEQRWVNAISLKKSSTPPCEKSSWNSRCIEAIQKGKAEVAKKYNIKFGRTEIYCASCGKPWGFGRHTCQEVRLKELHQTNKAKKESELSVLSDQGKSLREIGVALGVSHEAIRKRLKRLDLGVNQGKPLFRGRFYRLTPFWAIRIGL